jgi:hypothetical protein
VTILDRLTALIQSVIRETFPTLSFCGLYEYAVGSSANGTISATPTDTTLSLPPLSNVRVAPSLLGESSTPKIGATVLVEFLDGSPVNPRVISVSAVVSSAVDATSTLNVAPSASMLKIGAATARQARSGDPCAVYFWPATPIVVIGGTVGNVPLVGGLIVPSTTPGATPTPCLGSIGRGSTRVSS